MHNSYVDIDSKGTNMVYEFWQKLATQTRVVGIIIDRMHPQIYTVPVRFNRNPVDKVQGTFRLLLSLLASQYFLALQEDSRLRGKGILMRCKQYSPHYRNFLSCLLREYYIMIVLLWNSRLLCHYTESFRTGAENNYHNLLYEAIQHQRHRPCFISGVRRTCSIMNMANIVRTVEYWLTVQHQQSLFAFLVLKITPGLIVCHKNRFKKPLGQC